MIAELLVLASMLRLDPSGDAHGAGELIPPTAEVYSSLGPFDLVAVEVTGASQLVVRVRLSEIPDPGGLRNGVTLPVIDVYLDTAEGGREELLPGPGMRMPPGRGWEIALRVHGDDAYAVLADDPDGLPRPLTVIREDDVLRIEAPIPVPDELYEIHALTGVYDPFSVDGWRPLADDPSPWAFASELPAPPVVDLLAEDDDAQRAALQAFTLPSSPRTGTAIGWVIAMVAGLGLALAGLWLRRGVPAVRSAPPSTGDDALPESASDPDGSGDEASWQARAPEPDTGREGSAGSELALPTIWASSDGWWSEGEPPAEAAGAAHETTAGANDDTVGAGDDSAGASDAAAGERDDVAAATDEALDDDRFEASEDTPSDDDDEGSDGDGGPRPGAAGSDGAS